ncbi:hypothetical protein CsSME_00018215 [Camellia sinensis var. sinensis]
MNNTSGMFKIVPCTFAGDTSAAIADECITDMGDSVRAIEQLLNYRFNDKKLLEEALTHPSCTDSPSYQRLEFVGDAALGIAISNFIFLAYPDLLPGQLTLLRSANVSTEKLARAAVRHGLYKYVRRNAAALDEKVRDFTLAVQQEADMVVYGGMVKAPKVLADIVESVAAAVYVDRQFDLQAFWVIFRGILEPIVTLDVLQQQPQPVTMLFDFCQKEGKQVDIKHWRRGEKNIAIVYVDGEFIASSSSEQNENVRLHAAKAALEKLSHSNSEDKMNVDVYSSMNLTTEIEGAKQKLHDICGKKRWPKPTYRKLLSFEYDYLENASDDRSVAKLVLHCYPEHGLLFPWSAHALSRTERVHKRNNWCAKLEDRIKLPRRTPFSSSMVSSIFALLQKALQMKKSLKTCYERERQTCVCVLVHFNKNNDQILVENELVKAQCICIFTGSPPTKAAKKARVATKTRNKKTSFQSLQPVGNQAILPPRFTSRQSYDCRREACVYILVRIEHKS